MLIEMNNITKESDDDVCKLLNKKCFQLCYCDRTSTNDIIKCCDDSDIVKWESDIYLSFLDDNIFPNMDVNDNNIIYKVNGMQSIRKFLKTHTVNNIFKKSDIVINVNVFLNELFSYIRYFKRVGLIHGNLHIDNIFVKYNGDSNQFVFFTIDYSNAYNKRRSCPEPLYRRTSFMREYVRKDIGNEYEYWDFFTIYVALKVFLKDYNVKYNKVLNKLFNEILDPHMIKQYTMSILNNTNELI